MRRTVEPEGREFRESPLAPSMRSHSLSNNSHRVTSKTSSRVGVDVIPVHSIQDRQGAFALRPRITVPAPRPPLIGLRLVVGLRFWEEEEAGGGRPRPDRELDSLLQPGRLHIARLERQVAIEELPTLIETSRNRLRPRFLDPPKHLKLAPLRLDRFRRRRAQRRSEGLARRQFEWGLNFQPGPERISFVGSFLAMALPVAGG